MSTAALRPRSASEIVDAAFQILRAHYASFVMCTAIAYAPLLVVRLVVLGDPKQLQGADPGALRSLFLKYGLTYCASLITYVLMGAVLVTLTSQAYLGETVDVASAVRRVVQRLGAVLVAAVLSAIAILLGLMLLFLPGLYLTARLFAVSSVLLLEDTSVFEAFSRSGTLSKGRKRHILNTLGLAFIIYYILAFGGLAVTAMFGYVMQTVTTTVIVMLVYPVVAITNVLLYYDARIQSEGLDLELMADALGPTPSAV